MTNLPEINDASAQSFQLLFQPGPFLQKRPDFGLFLSQSAKSSCLVVCVDAILNRFPWCAFRTLHFGRLRRCRERWREDTRPGRIIDRDLDYSGKEGEADDGAEKKKQKTRSKNQMQAQKLHSNLEQSKLKTQSNEREKHWSVSRLVLVWPVKYSVLGLSAGKI